MHFWGAAGMLVKVALGEGGKSVEVTGGGCFLEVLAQRFMRA